MARVAKRAVIRGKIAEYMSTYGKSAEDMARKMKMSPATWYRRVRNPGQFSVAELELLELITGLEIIGGKENVCKN